MIRISIHHLFLTLALLVCFSARSQTDITNKGIDVTINNVRVYLNGDLLNTSDSLTNSEDGAISSNDSLYITGDIRNKVDNGLFSGNNDVIFNGVANQEITGISHFSFNRIWLQKPSGVLQLQQSIDVSDEFNFSQGNIDLGSDTIDLGLNGELVNESDNSRVSSQTGFVVADRLLSGSNVNTNLAGIGLYIGTSYNFGLTELQRSQSSQTGAGDGSINRYWNFIPSNENGLVNDIKLKYFDADLNGIPEEELAYWQSNTLGTIWSNNGGSVDTTTNIVSATNQTLKNSILTASRSDCNTNPVSNLPDTTSLCPGLSTLLDVGLAGHIYNWSTGDSTQTIEVNAVGSYTVTITSVNGCETIDTTYLEQRPIPNASFNQGFACFGDTNSFINTSTISGNASLSYFWDFGDTNLISDTSNLENPEYLYAQAGQYTTTLIVTSEFGCSDTATANTLSHALPNVDFFTIGTCEDSITTFYDSTSIASPYAINSRMWDFGDGTISNLQNPTHAYSGAGDFEVSLTITSNAGCVDSLVDSITIFPNPVATFTAIGACENTPISITNNSTVASGSLTYAWSFGDGSTSTQATPNKSYSADTTYDIILVANAGLGCIDRDTQSVTIADSPVAQFTSNNGCLSDTVFFTDQSSVNNSTLSYDWDFGDGSSSINQNPFHIYTSVGSFTAELKVTSTNGCADSISYGVQVYPIPNAAFSVDDECFGEQHNILNTSTLSSGSMTYQWSFGDNSNSTNSNPVKTYGDSGVYQVNLIATSNQGCADTTSSTVEVFSLPEVNLGGNVTTCGTSIVLDAGNPGASYSWNTFATSQTITATNNGTYSVTITDANGCTSSDVANVTLNSTPTLDLGPDQTVCEQSTLDAFVPGGSYDWSSGDTTASISVTTTNQYWVEVTDQNGCTVSDTIQVDVLSDPIVSLGANDTICDGDSVLIDAQNSGNLFAWNTGETSQQIYANTTGTYSVTVTDSICSASDSVFVQVNPNPVIDLGPDSSYCVTHTILAGDSALDYSWNTGDTTQAISVTTSGQYLTTATNVFGCTSVDSVQITINQLPTVDLGPDSAFCDDDSFLIDPIVSTTVSYLWNDGSTDSTLAVGDSGVFSLTITDGNGCSEQDSINMGLWPLPIVDFEFSNACEDSLVQFSDSSEILSGYSITSHVWDFGDGTGNSTQHPSHSYLNFGNYTVKQIVTSDKGCADSASMNITIHPNPVASFTADSVCEAVDINLVNNSTIANGSLTRSWDFGDNTSSNLPAPAKNYFTYGDYLVELTVSSAFGCTDVDTQTVRVHDVPNANFSVSNVCVSDSAQFNNLSSVNNAALSSAWTFGDGGTSNLEDPAHLYSAYGNYTAQLNVTSEYSCSDSYSQALTVHELPSPDFIANDECFGDQHSFTNTSSINSGSMIYNWDFDDGSNSTQTSPTKTYATTGVYQVQLTATSNQGCQDSITKAVEVFTLPTVNIGDSITTCGSSFVLDAQNAGSSYNWSTFATTQQITANTNGNYSVTVTDNNGCTGRDTAHVTLNVAAITNLGPDITACGSATIDAFAPGSTYDWSTGDTTASITVNTSGTYWVDVLDQNNCPSSDTINVTINPFPVVDLGQDDTLCQGESLVLDAQNAGATYQWNTNATTQQITVSATGDYSVTVTNNGCASSDTVAIQVNPLPTVDLGEDSSYCVTHTLVAGDSNNNYAWNTGDTTASITVTNTNDYQVTVSNEFDCSVSDTVNVTIHDAPTVDLGRDTSFCQGFTFTIVPQVSEAVNYLWGNASTDTTRTVGATGSYKVTVSNANGCIGLDSVSVIFHSNPSPELGANIVLLSDDTATLKTGDTANIWSHVWANDSGIVSTDSVYVTADSGIYYVTVTDTNGCVGIDSVVVTKLNQSLIARFLAVSEAEVGDTIQFIQLSYPDPLNYAWDFGDGATSTDSNAQHIYFLADTFDVRLIAYNNTASDTAVKTIVITDPSSNAKELPEPEEIISNTIFSSVNLYPNPTQDRLTLELELNDDSEGEIEFYNIQGVRVHSDQFGGTRYRTDYDFNHLSPGIYFMRVVIGFEIKTYKFIKL